MDPVVTLYMRLQPIGLHDVMSFTKGYMDTDRSYINRYALRTS
jgi:hypothetical protein